MRHIDAVGQIPRLGPPVSPEIVKELRELAKQYSGCMTTLVATFLDEKNTLLKSSQLIEEPMRCGGQSCSSITTDKPPFPLSFKEPIIGEYIGITRGKQNCGESFKSERGKGE